MRKESLQLVIVSVLGSFLVTGCVYSHRAWVREPPTVVCPAGEIMVTESPRPPRREIVGTPPNEAHAWVPGYWIRSNYQWVWITGHGEVPLQPAAARVPGH